MKTQHQGSRGTPLLVTWFTLVVGFLTLTPPGWAQDVVALRSSAVLDGGGPIRLDRIADITGPSAERLSAIVIDAAEVVPDKQGWMVIDLDCVRRTLEKSGTENWGRLTLRGSACNVRRLANTPVEPVKPAESPRSAPTGPTVRDVVRARLAQVYDAGDENLRLVFDESDARLLDTSTEGLVADVQLIGSSERQPVSVRLYKDLATVASGQVRVTVSIKQSVAVSIGGLRRGQTFEDASFTIEERWIGPTIRPADPSAVLGQFARGRISAGQVIEATDIEPPVVIKKGELADVVCLAGSMSVKVKARAMEPGRVGERIGFQLLDSARTFRARVDGPARAITDTGNENSGDGLARDDRSGIRSDRRVTTVTGTTKKPTADAREAARAAAREADRKRNLYLDLSDRKLVLPGATGGPIGGPAASVQSGVFSVTRGVPTGTPGDPAAALQRLMKDQENTEDRR